MICACVKRKERENATHSVQDYHHQILLFKVMKPWLRAAGGEHKEVYRLANLPNLDIHTPSNTTGTKMNVYHLECTHGQDAMSC